MSCKIRYHSLHDCVGEYCCTAKQHSLKKPAIISKNINFVINEIMVFIFSLAAGVYVDLRLHLQSQIQKPIIKSSVVTSNSLPFYCFNLLLTKCMKFNGSMVALLREWASICKSIRALEKNIINYKSRQILMSNCNCMKISGVDSVLFEH